MGELNWIWSTELQAIVADRSPIGPVYEIYPFGGNWELRRRIGLAPAATIVVGDLTECIRHANADNAVFGR